MWFFNKNQPREHHLDRCPEKASEGDARSAITWSPSTVLEGEKLPPYQIKVREMNCPEANVKPASMLPAGVKIAFLDDPYEMILSQNPNDVVYGSHLNAIRHWAALPEESIEMYDHTGGITFDSKRVVQSLKHIVRTHKESGVRVVNLSFGANITFEEINDVIGSHGSKDANKRGPVTADNLRGRLDDVREAYANWSKEGTAPQWFRDIQRQSELIRQLHDEGVLVVASSGNGANGQTVNLDSVLSPLYS